MALYYRNHRVNEDDSLWLSSDNNAATITQNEFFGIPETPPAAPVNKFKAADVNLHQIQPSKPFFKHLRHTANMITYATMGNNIDGVSYSMGTVVQPLVNGQIEQIWYYSPAASTNTSREVGIYGYTNPDSNVLYTGTNSEENVAFDKWNHHVLSTPLSVTANNPYIVAILRNDQYYGYVNNLFNSSDLSNGSDIKAPDTNAYNNGLFRETATMQPPNSTYQGSWYGIDVGFWVPYTITTRTFETFGLYQPPFVMSSPTISQNVGSGTDVLPAATGVTIGSPNTPNAVLKQIHARIATPVTIGAPVNASATIHQIHDLPSVTAPTLGTMVVGSTNIEQIHDFTTTGVSFGISLPSITLKQIHDLPSVTVTTLSAVALPSISSIEQIHELAATGVIVSFATISPVLEQIHDLGTATGVPIGQFVLDEPDLLQTNNLSTSLTLNGFVVGEPDIGQTHEFVATGVTFSVSLPSVTLKQIHDLPSTSNVTLGTMTVGSTDIGIIYARNIDDINLSAPVLPSITIKQIHELGTATGISTGAIQIPEIEFEFIVDFVATGVSVSFNVPSINLEQIHELSATGTNIPAIIIQTPYFAGAGHFYIDSFDITISMPSVSRIYQTHDLVGSGINSSAPTIQTAHLEQIHELSATGINSAAPVVQNVSRFYQKQVLEEQSLSINGVVISSATIHQKQNLGSADGIELEAIIVDDPDLNIHYNMSLNNVLLPTAVIDTAHFDEINNFAIGEFEIPSLVLPVFSLIVDIYEFNIDEVAIGGGEITGSARTRRTMYYDSL